MIYNIYQYTDEQSLNEYLGIRLGFKKNKRKKKNRCFLHVNKPLPKSNLYIYSK